jgi:hypothetical protein
MFRLDDGRDRELVAATRSSVNTVAPRLPSSPHKQNIGGQSWATVQQEQQQRHIEPQLVSPTTRIKGVIDHHNPSFDV